MRDRLRVQRGRRAKHGLFSAARQPRRSCVQLRPMTIAANRAVLSILTAVLAVTGGPAFAAAAQSPDLDTWLQNTTGLTGYGGLPANVQRVQYSTPSVYVSCS